MTDQMKQNERVEMVDILRGFALTGVLFANFMGYVSQQMPETVLKKTSTGFDTALINFNSIFIEWKFVTLFSIIFGYGFGLILEGLERKNMRQNLFFLKRMFWLFLFGVVHCGFWWGDVLNLYAMSGVLLLLFRKSSTRVILLCSLFFIFILPVGISYLLRNQPETFTENDLDVLFTGLHQTSLAGLIKFNLDFSYRMFFASGVNLHDVPETLGRFLFGYYLLRLKLFDNVEAKKQLFRRVLIVTAPCVAGYFVIRALLLSGSLEMNQYFSSFFLSIGIFATTAFYVSVLIIIYISSGKGIVFSALQSLGRMTLTNYLLISAFMVILLYGVGFGLLGKIHISTVWLLAVVWLLIEVVFTTYWLKQYRYGPAEWIWRQLTYWKRMPLRRNSK